MSKIKIVFVHWTLNVGGTERQFVEMVQRLNRHIFDPRVLVIRSYGKLRAELEVHHISVLCLNFSASEGRFHYRSYLQLYRLLREMVRYFLHEKPHIVQSYLSWANICATIAGKIARVPIILTGRRAILDEKFLKFPVFPDQWLQNLSNCWATAVVANSYNVRQRCLHRERFLPAEKIRVLYNGVDLDAYRPAGMMGSLKGLLRIPEHSHIVGMVATIRPRKGHHILLKAAARIVREIPDTVFLLVGRDSGLQTELEDFANDLGIGKAIFFTGERDDVPEILSIIDILVSSSLYEGLSNALLEGMAAGKPIVATEIAGNAEIVMHGQTGFIVPPGNPDALAEAIMRLLQDKALQKQMGKAGRQRAEKLFGMERMIREAESFYLELLASRSIIS